MRVARLQTPAGPQHAIASTDRWMHVDDPYADEPNYTGESTSFDDAVLLAPVQPRLIIGIAHNLTNNDHPLPMQAWHKSVHTLANPGDVVESVRGVGTVNIEGELAVVIGKRATRLTEENAFDAVFGYTVANDVTNVDQVAIDDKFFQSKSGVNYTPIGPWIETAIDDPENVATEVVINGELRASSGSFNLPSTVAASLAYVTRWLTLEPGDVVLTGAPKTIVAVQPGDTVDITLAGIGTLSNSIG